MLVIRLDRAKPGPVHEQLAAEIRRRIRDGFLPAGSRLPSSRALARACGVGRNTVVGAYDALVAEGVLDSAVGRGTFVTGEIQPATDADPAPAHRSSIDWEAQAVRRISRPLLGAQEPAPTDDAIDLASAVPAEDTYPVGVIRRILAQVLSDDDPGCLGYGLPAGHLGLREVLATRLTQWGTVIQPDDLLIVGGMQQGLDLIARLLVGPGDTVLVESPTYANAIRVFELYGARVVGVPLDDQGLRPDALAWALDRNPGTKLVYVMPTFQNPTGLTMGLSRRRAIMDVIDGRGVPLLEDQFDSELRYSGRPIPPLHAMDAGGQVLLLGTFSKILFPGFRLGWVAAPPGARARLLDVKRTCDLATSQPLQVALARFCRDGELDRHLDRVRRIHSGRLEALLLACAEYFPPGVHLTRPEGGMTAWVTLPSHCDASSIQEEAREAGVLIAPGHWFHAGDGGHQALRVTFVNEPEERIRQGVVRLGAILARHVTRPPGKATASEEATPFL